MEPIVLAIAIGLVVSLLFSELFGLAAGGMVVPGYVALYLDRPLAVVLTLAVALVTFGLVRAVSQVAIVYGRRRTVLAILVGFLLGAIVRVVGPWIAGSPSDFASGEMTVIGFIIPGLIALWIDRQGVVETLGVLLSTSVIVRLTIILVAAQLLV